MQSLKYINVEFRVPENFSNKDLIALLESGIQSGYRVWNDNSESYHKLKTPTIDSNSTAIPTTIEILLNTEEDGSYTRGV